MGKQPVTAWYRLDRSRLGGSFAFNHIEDGHANEAKPTDPFQRGWSAATWFSRHGHLHDGQLKLEPSASCLPVPMSEPIRSPRGRRES